VNRERQPSDVCPERSSRRDLRAVPSLLHSVRDARWGIPGTVKFARSGAFHTPFRGAGVRPPVAGKAGATVDPSIRVDSLAPAPTGLLLETHELAGTTMSADELTPYDLFVLKGHEARSRRESEVEKRRVVLLKLSRLGYLRFSAGVYSITPAGRRVLEERP